MRLGILPHIPGLGDVLALFAVRLRYGSLQLENMPKRNVVSSVARGPTDPSAVLELHLPALVTKDLQAEEADGSHKGSKRGAGLSERTQRIEDGLIVHFPFGPRGSTVSGRQTASIMRWASCSGGTPRSRSPELVEGLQELHRRVAIEFFTLVAALV